MIDDLQGTFWGVQPIPDKTAKKVENQSKEGPINTTVGKSGLLDVFVVPWSMTNWITAAWFSIKLLNHSDNWNQMKIIYILGGPKMRLSLQKTWLFKK